jgi:D-xylose transport system substrate-binding protein
MRRSNLAKAFAIALTGVLLGACAGGSQDKTGSARNRKSGPIRVGLSLDTLKEERWQFDRDIFAAHAKELGADVLIKSASGDDSVQTDQAESLLNQQDVDVLVVIPHNAETCASIVGMARQKNIPVISYDRLILDSEPDLYISFDSVKVGELEASYLLDLAPRGNYILIGGPPTDNNAQLLRQGQMKVLKPAIDSGAVKIVADKWARDWQPQDALEKTETALARNPDVTAIVASNDVVAGAVVQALEEEKLAGKVLVSGQDADLAALQRIVAGTQTMTVYKPINKLARRAAEAAVALARGEKIQTTGTVNNRKIDVPSILIEPIAVDKSNMLDAVINDGYQKIEDVYRYVPLDQWPRLPR